MSDLLFADYEPRDDTPTRPTPDFSIRAANDDDLPAVVDMIQRRDGGRTDRHLAGLRQDLDAGTDGACLLVAVVAATIIGYGRAGWFQRPPKASPRVPVAGWHLRGLLVDQAYRRHGIALAITQRRLQWIASRANAAYYIANAANRPSIDLHARLGFREVMRDIEFPGVTFTHNIGLLFRADLHR